jgi:hypothetical protein
MVAGGLEKAEAILRGSAKQTSAAGEAAVGKVIGNGQGGWTTLAGNAGGFILNGRLSVASRH